MTHPPAKDKDAIAPAQIAFQFNLVQEAVKKTGVRCTLESSDVLVQIYPRNTDRLTLSEDEQTQDTLIL